MKSKAHPPKRRVPVVYVPRRPSMTIFDTPRMRRRAAELRALELLSFAELQQRNLLR